MPATGMAQNQTLAGDPIYTDAAAVTARFVLMDPLSGPSGSPLNGNNSIGGNMTYPSATGGLSNCIGFGARNAQNSGSLTKGLPSIPPGALSPNTSTAAANAAGCDYIDDLLIGVRPAWAPAGATGDPAKPVRADSEMVYIGGGRSNIAGGLPGGLSVNAPYTQGTNVAGFGNGGSRDAGAGPAFTSFAAKIVTATATVANGAVVETGFANRSGGSITNGQSTFGSATAATVAPA